MKTIVDIRALVPEKSGGIIQNIVGVLRELLATARPGETYIAACTLFNRHLVETIPGLTDVITLPLHRYYDALEALRLKHEADVVFHVYPRGDCVDYDLSKRVFYIPDLQHEFHPEFFTADVISGRQAAFYPVLQSAGAIGTISDYSRSTLQNHPLCKCDDIFLMPPALQQEHADKPLDNLTKDELAQIPATDFLFFPANFWPHKNHRRLFEALRILTKRHGITIPLLLTGAPDAWPALAREFSDLPIRHLGYVSGQLVSALLSKATALCFFSLYEGFGIPLLEAFHVETPVVCSNTTSLPEIAGDAALYASPLDPDEMAAALHRILTEPGLRQTLIENGRKRLAYFSWRQSAENLRAALGRVARRNPIAQPVKPRQISATEKRPLVSIVTPSFNQARFIADTIESVLNQSYDHIEYIVIDGGSTDGTIDILKGYGDRIRWISEPDQGQTDAINKGMALMQGEILAYLNSDDVLELNAVAEVVEFFAENQSVDMVYGEALYIDEHGAEIGRYRTAPYTSNALIYDCMICQPAAFWRRRITNIIGPFDTSLHYAMDYDYWLRMRKANAGIVHRSQVWARSRLHSDTKTIGQRGKVFGEIFEVCRRHVGFVAVQYFEGLWHFRLVESHRRLGPIIGSFPSIWRSVARLHRLIYFARNGILRRAIGAKFRFKADHGATWAGWLLQLYQWFNRKRRNQAGAEAPSRRLKGFWADNWFSGQVSLTSDSAAPARSVFIRGVSPLNCRLDVSLNGRNIWQQDLAGGQRSFIEFRMPALSPGDKILISFSYWDSEMGGRQLAFLIDNTNLFTESDSF